MRYACCDQNRGALVDGHATLNGISWLEVLDLNAPPGSPRQQTLLIRLFKPVPPGLSPINIRITGGERIRNVGVEWVGIASDPIAESTAAEGLYFQGLEDPQNILVVRTDTSGDTSDYTLRLVAGLGSSEQLPDFDPILSEIAFSFKVECPSDLDCDPPVVCHEEPLQHPDLNYLARDYQSIRQLVMDRLSFSMPDWEGHRSPADVVHMLGELIAYVGDQQHYQLDTIANEAYLRLARRRTSLRRHALLVDYHVHDGCNARAWLSLDVSGDDVPLPADIRFTTRVAHLPARIPPGSEAARTALAKAQVFEPVDGQDLTFRADHNDFEFYTWSDARCCLSEGATSATLAGHWPRLEPGQVLIFREVLGPLTGQEADADPAHCHAVRLTRVRAFNEAMPLVDPLNNAQITEIAWSEEDALPFPLCISSQTDEAHGEALIENVSIVRGNIVLVDHGLSVDGEDLGTVPASHLAYPLAHAGPCNREVPKALPPRFAPQLASGPVTQQGTVMRTRMIEGVRRSERVPFDPDASARAAMTWHVNDAVPEIRLRSDFGGSFESWTPERDLLQSRDADRHFVLETESDGHARIRFGDDKHGRRPDAGTDFSASYRLGNGPAGNVGIDTITHAITADGRITAITNPLPGTGGTRPETMDEVRRNAPYAYRRQERAVTPEDMAEVMERMDGVSRAAATLRWTGSWHTVFVTVDRDGGVPVDPAFEAAALAHLERFRMAGQDIRIENPIYVSLELHLLVCVKDEYFPGHVRAQLLEWLGSGRRSDGERAVFHPDNFTFGDTVYLSRIYASARQVPGVASVQATLFQRVDRPDPKPLAEGLMAMDRLEIARLANDPNFREHGSLQLTLIGGK